MELTKDEQEDVMNRTKSFMEKYEALVKESQIDFANVIVPVPTDHGTFEFAIQTYPVDNKYRPIKSDLSKL